MPGMRCAVSCCKNSHTLNKMCGTNISFHRFPKSKDSESSTIREKWINRCNRATGFNPNTSTICSVHFTKDDFERDFQNELLGLRTKRILKKTAIPTLNLKSDNIAVLEIDEPQASTDLPNQILGVLLDHTYHKTINTSGYTLLLRTASVQTSPLRVIDYETKYENLLKWHKQFKKYQARKIKALKAQTKYYQKKSRVLSEQNEKLRKPEHIYIDIID